jgi:mRNA interferase MazF
MEKLVAGDVVVVPFPFTTLERAKRRPAFVLAVLPDDDYIFCQITSRAWPQSIPLRTSDFVEGTLPHDSYVRPEKLFTGNQALVLSRVGHSKSTVQQRIYRRLLELFQVLSDDSDALGPPVTQADEDRL